MGLNIVVLQGRCSKKPEAHHGEQAPFIKWQIAVERTFKSKVKTDFITCIAFGILGRNAYKNLGKGALHSVVGQIRESRWEINGQKKRNVVVFVSSLTIHQWLNKGKSVSELAEEFPNRRIPTDVLDAMWKGMDFENETEEEVFGFGSKAIEEILAEEEVKLDDEDIPNV